MRIYLFIYLFIYLHILYSWQSLIIYYNRYFFPKKRLAFAIVFCKANQSQLISIKERTQ